MPVVRISALPAPPDIDVTAVLRAVTSALAATLGEEPEGSWATWEEISPGRYVEGPNEAGAQPSSTHPPLVRVLAFEGRSPEMVGEMLACVAGVLAEQLRLEPGNVFVTYEEIAAGRVHTGGALVERG